MTFIDRLLLIPRVSIFTCVGHATSLLQCIFTRVEHSIQVIITLLLCIVGDFSKILLLRVELIKVDLLLRLISFLTNGE